MSNMDSIPDAAAQSKDAKLPPHNREAERAVLGSMLRHNQCIGDVARVVGAEDFYADAHQKIYRGILALHDKPCPADLVTLAEYAKEKKQMQDIGGPAYIAELWDAAPTAANFAYYAGIVREHSERRALILLGQKIARDARDGVAPAVELRDRAQNDLGAIGSASKSGLETQCMNTLNIEPIRWLVPGHIPLGKLVLFAGDGGHGKSTLTLDIAACLTTGRPCFGMNYKPMPPCDVLLVSCEDDAKDTVVPRLLSAGADLSRVWKVEGIKTKSGTVAPFSLAHYEQMERELAAKPDIRLVVIDPAGAFVGRAKVDDHKDSELRALLGPLGELASRRQVTILLVKHFNKSATSKAVYKIGGSGGYVNTVRAAFIITPDAEDESRKLLLPVKGNLGPKPDGIAYRMRSLDAHERNRVLDSYAKHLSAEDRELLGQQLFRIDWLGECDDDADAVIGEQGRADRSGNKVERCAAWMETFLNTYAYPSDEINRAAEASGYTKDNVFRAKAQLKAKGLRNCNRFPGKQWWSGFGEPHTWRQRPEEKPPNTPDIHNTPDIQESPKSTDIPETHKSPDYRESLESQVTLESLDSHVSLESLDSHVSLDSLDDVSWVEKLMAEGKA
jgi:hypothetical protein